MAEEFKPISTQEELDRVIGERLKRQETSIRDEYKEYMKPESVAELRKDYDTKIEQLNAQVKDFNTKIDAFGVAEKKYQDQIAKYESDSVKTRIAIEEGIPLELRDRLKGATEEEIREDAKLFKGFAKANPIAPLANSEVHMSPEEAKKAANDSAIKQLLKDLG